jgi:hypothetical protein
MEWYLMPGHYWLELRLLNNNRTKRRTNVNTEEDQSNENHESEDATNSHLKIENNFETEGPLHISTMAPREEVVEDSDREIDEVNDISKIVSKSGIEEEMKINQSIKF